MINKSYSYLIPLLNTKCNIDSAYFILIKNVYCSINKEVEKPIIVIVYEKLDNDMYNEYLTSLYENELTENVIENDDEIIFIFNFPEEFREEYYLYINGKFSMFSQKAKDVIIDFIGNYHKSSSVWKIKKVLYKEQQLREYLEKKLDLKIDEDMELSSIPDLEKESIILTLKYAQDRGSET